MLMQLTESSGNCLGYSPLVPMGILPIVNQIFINDMRILGIGELLSLRSFTIMLLCDSRHRLSETALRRLSFGEESKSSGGFSSLV